MTSGGSDDAALVARLRLGETAAFAEAFERYADRLYRVALGVLGDPDEAEDAVQETFITLARRLEGFEQRSSLGTWLYRVALNADRQRLRAASRRPRASAHAAGDEAPVELVADPDPGPPARAEAAELGVELDAAIASLPDTLRLALVLRDIEGFSTAEAADLLEITPAALKVRLHRARLQLRERLTPGELPPQTAAAGMTCAQAVELVSAYLDDELDAATRDRLEAHVSQCDHCRLTVDSTRRELVLAGERRELVLLPPRSARLLERLAAIFAARAGSPPSM